MQAHEGIGTSMVGRYASIWLLIGILLAVPVVRSAVAIVDDAGGTEPSSLSAVTPVVDDVVQPASVRARTTVTAEQHPLNETTVWTVAAAIAAIACAAIRILRSTSGRRNSSRWRTLVTARLRAPPVSML